MKRIIIVAHILFLASLLSAQSWISSNRITTSETLFELSSIIDDNGNVLTFGYFSGTLDVPDGTTLDSYGLRDYFVIKFLPNGDFSWIRNFGSINMDFATGDMDIDATGNIYITGGFTGYLRYTATDSLESFGSYDIFFAKLDEDGNTLWARNAGKGATLQFPTALKVTNGGNIILAGGFYGSINIYDTHTLLTDNTVADAYYAEFNLDGDINWIKQVKTLSNPPVYLWSIVSTDNNLYFEGAFLDSIGFENDTIVSDKKESNVFLLKTDLSGTIEWNRLIEGNIKDFSFTMVGDDEDNLYLAGYSNSDTLLFETSNSQFIEEIGNNGSFDIFIAKYQPDGILSWHRKIGGNGDDRVFALEFFDSKVYMSGRFADTLSWGGIDLISTGVSDYDMFTGAFDPDGNYRDANSFSGRNGSKDESRGIFQNGDILYTIMISNSDRLIIGDSIYDSDGLTDYIVLGIIGCLPISVDNTIPTNITGCFGDATGSIQVVASGGFGTPWQYSIDNGLNYSTIAYYQNLPAGDYQVVVIDKENCTQVGPLITLTEPDSLEVQVVSTEDITADHDGSIVVVAQGGTSPYIYWLQPDGAPQTFGTFVFSTGDSGKYVVAVDDLNNCGPALTDSLVIQEITDTTGIGTSSGLLVKIYPNPTSGNITVEMPFEGAECEMEVLSMTGQLVLKRKVYSSGGVITETLDLSDQAKGLYMLRINGQALRSAIMVK